MGHFFVQDVKFLDLLLVSLTFSCHIFFELEQLGHLIFFFIGFFVDLFTGHSFEFAIVLMGWVNEVLVDRSLGHLIREVIVNSVQMGWVPILIWLIMKHLIWSIDCFFSSWFTCCWFLGFSSRVWFEWFWFLCFWDGVFDLSDAFCREFTLVE